MKALSIRQPWAWAILLAGKDVENRSWATKFRGRVLIHAALHLRTREFEEDCSLIRRISGESVLSHYYMRFGGIVGSVEIVDCVVTSASPWFFGPWGFVLRDPRPLPFVPLRGQLGFFDVSDEVLR